ncbi:MAG: response regulator transcription factor [Campylobacterota bacterium]|nr:response regulator transcription factor [Campylobacterota bacterium]
MRVLLLEDEHLLNTNIKDFLEFKGMLVESYTNGADLLKNSTFKADIAILDIEVPGANGYEVIEWIKQVDSEIPTIFMTAYTDITSIEKAYDLGCSDYLKKPFDLIELWLRVQHLLDLNDLLKISLGDGVVFDIEREQLYCKNEMQKLTKIQRQILKSLIKHKNSIVTYDLLMEEVWNDEFVKVNTIASHVKELRKYVPNNLIESIRAEGYRLHIQ